MSKYFDGDKLSGYEDSSITYVYGGNLEECHKVIADLEAKLAESEERLKAKESVNQMYKATLNLKDIDFSDLVIENAQLKQQLAEKDGELHQIYSHLGVEAFGEDIHEQALKEIAEKDQAIEGLQEINKSLGQTCNNDAKEIERLREELADLQQEQIKEMQEHQVAMEFADKTITNLVEDNRASQEWYKKKLAEKDKEIEKITKIVAYRNDMDMSTTINGVKFTNEQIITLQNIDYFADKHNQDKISFAVEQLNLLYKTLTTEDVWRVMKKGWWLNNGECKQLRQIIDNQIKALK